MGITSSNSTDVEVKAALQTPGRVVIDCRAAGEVARGDGFSGAINIPVDSLENRLSDLKDKETTIITYCAGGVRSARAAGILKSNGYVNVYSTTNADHIRDILK